ncbi:MAG: aminotransferase class III-fold pyridoxal phosphate-dependent enzyme [Microthrixaceae bacterium]
MITRTTYGGQPFAAAAARAVLAVMAENDVASLAETKGAQLSARLSELSAVRAVRGLGLLLAVEIDVDRTGVPAATIASLLLERSLVVNAVTPTALRLAPSLLISDDEIDHAVTVLSATLDELVDANDATPEPT